MFSSNRRPEPSEEATDLAPETATPITEAMLRAHQAEALERRLNSPSTFASRKAKADADASARALPALVFFGTAERTATVNPRGDVQVIEVEMYYEKNHPNRRWFRLPPRGEMTPLFDDTRRDPAPVPLGRIRTGMRFLSSHPDAGPESSQRVT